MMTYSKLRRNKVEVDTATYAAEYERAYDFMTAQLHQQQQFPYNNAHTQRATALRCLNEAYAEGEKHTLYVARQSGFFHAARDFTEGVR